MILMILTLKVLVLVATYIANLSYVYTRSTNEQRTYAARNCLTGILSSEMGRIIRSCASLMCCVYVAIR